MGAGIFMEIALSTSQLFGMRNTETHPSTKEYDEYEYDTTTTTTNSSSSSSSSSSDSSVAVAAAKQEQEQKLVEQYLHRRSDLLWQNISTFPCSSPNHTIVVTS